MSEIRIKRVYDPPSDEDGTRILVDRLWPRGLKRDKAKIDLWLKDAAPSAELRRWFAHDPSKWPGFQERYQVELAGSAAIDELLTLIRNRKRVTLLFGAKDTACNNAVVLEAFCERNLGHTR